MESHAAGAGLPLRAGAMAAEAGELVPGFAAVGGFEESGIFNAGEDGVGIGERRLEMPDALEFPGMLCAVVPLVSGERRAGFSGGVVDEFIGFAHGPTLRGNIFFSGRRAGLEPGFAAIIGTLDDLAEPAAGLRSVDAVGVGGGALEVIDFPAGEMRARDLPIFALAIGGEDKSALARANQDSNGAHD